jgi:hypothetical protein
MNVKIIFVIILFTGFLLAALLFAGEAEELPVVVKTPQVPKVDFASFQLYSSIEKLIKSKASFHKIKAFVDASKAQQIMNHVQSSPVARYWYQIEGVGNVFLEVFVDSSGRVRLQRNWEPHNNQFADLKIEASIQRKFTAEEMKAR